MPDSKTRNVLIERTADVIEASARMCSSSRGHLIQSEDIVRLSRETIASSIALLVRVNDPTLSDDL